jgi:GT2 family glycosyltransferase
MIAREFPTVVLIESPGNLGFAEGNNVAIRRAVAEGADAVFLLNNDTVIDEPFVEACLSVLRDYPDVGVVGPVVVECDSPQVIQAAGGSWNLWTVTMPFRGRGTEFRRSNQVEFVDWVLGAAMLIRASSVPAAGGALDPEFFPAYLEEAEFCYRARKAGYRSAVTYAVRVRHIGGQSSGGRSVAFGRMMVNRFRFALKHLGLVRFTTASVFIVLQSCLKRVSHACNSATR